MIRKNSTLLLVVFITATQISCATDKSERRESGFKPKSTDAIMAELTPRLKLTEEQKTKVQPIIQSFTGKRNDIITNARQQGRRSGSSDEITNLHNDTERLLAVVLTEEQMNEYRKYRAEEQKKAEDAKQNRRGGGMRGGGRGGGFGMGGFGR